MPRHSKWTISTISLLLLAGTAFSQPLMSWEELPEAPFTSRHNDIYFVDGNTGWVVNGSAEIYRTDDAGDTWTPQWSNEASHLRSVGFLNKDRGFVGNVGEGEFGTTDPVSLYETSDGGATWSAVTDYQGDGTPQGVCGMFVINDSSVVAVGRVRGPSWFMRTTDGGDSWVTKDMSEYAAGLIDAHFTHPDTGFVVGLTNEDHDLSTSIVLHTTDGGETWTRKYRGGRQGEWAWKLSFPTRQVGYASLQRNSKFPIYFLKTTDGGETWDHLIFRSEFYFVQGLGFIDENRGWIGGNSSDPVYETNDGGISWFPEQVRARINRFRFVGDSLGFAVGRTIHRIRQASSVASESETVTRLRTLTNAPNPFQSTTRITFENYDNADAALLEVFDMRGRRVRTLLNGFPPAGKISVEWAGLNDAGARLPSGVYLASLTTGAVRQTRPITFIGH